MDSNIMLTADKIKILTEFGPKGIAATLAKSGYTGAAFKAAKFLGLTNGGEFCYEVTYYDDGGGPEETLEAGKVFLSYDPNTDTITADY